MELPYGFTKEEIKEIVDEWDEFYLQITSNCYPFNEIEFDEVYEDDEYIDRYIWVGDAEFCISTKKWNEGKRANIHYLSENIYLNKNGNSEPFFIEELRQLVG